MSHTHVKELGAAEEGGAGPVSVQEPDNTFTRRVCAVLLADVTGFTPTVERQRVRPLCDSLVVSYPDKRLAPIYPRLLASLRSGDHDHARRAALTRRNPLYKYDVHEGSADR